MNVPVVSFETREAAGSAMYGFRGGRGAVAWPTDGGAFLGTAGCWNFAMRIGALPREIASDDVSRIPNAESLFVALDGEPVHPRDRESLRKRIDAGGIVIGSGGAPGWAAIVPELFPHAANRPHGPDAGLAYRIGPRVELIAPPRWPFASFQDLSGWDQTIGEVVTVSGERQTPSRAILRPQTNAPALLRRGNFLYCNGSPFHALQAWLQGQEDLRPWMQWRQRLFWLDEFTAALRTLIESAGITLPQPTGVAALTETSVVIRHDLDHSRDTAYLQREVERGIPAVHAVLRDANTSFWVDTLAAHPDHEVAFHYNTARYSRVTNAIRRIFGRAVRSYTPAVSEIARNGLANQVRWARARRVGTATLHRHLSYLIYPEWVDAFDAVQQREPQVLGGSSVFRATVVRWGVDRADGVRGTYVETPDTPSPFWMPFRLAHAGDRGRMLRVWESASLIEPEPELIEQMLAHRIPGLPQRVFTFGFHPAHARGARWAPEGGVRMLERVLDILSANKVQILTLRSIYEAMNAHFSQGKVGC